MSSDPTNPTPETPAPAPAPETAVTAAKPAPTAVAPKPAAPAKPAAKPAAKGKDRRSFLVDAFGTWFGIAWVAFSASMLGMVLGTVRFLFPNVLSEPPSSFKAGDLSNYEPNVVTDAYKDRGVWVVRGRDDRGREIIYALSTVCTHLGCTPNWLEGEQKFKCPCHGSGFYMNGVNFEGPAPRPLERYAVTRTDDNQVLVDKSLKFQRELGQWDDPKSYILL